MEGNQSEWEEVIVDEGYDMAIEDDDESMMGEDNVEEVFFDGEEGSGDKDDEDEEVVDMSVFTFEGHSDSVYCAALHPTQAGVVITGGGDDRAFIWRYRSGATTGGEEPLGRELVSSFELKGHSDTINAVGFNHDGTLALTGGFDGMVKIWDVATGELKQTLEGPEDIEWAAWHGKGNAVAAGSRDGTSWMWMALEGTCMQVFAGHDGDVTGGLFTGDGKHVCTGGSDGTIRIWAPRSGSCKHVFQGKDGFEGAVTCMASSEDGTLVLSGSVDGSLKLHHIGNKRTLVTFTHSDGNAVNNSPPVPQDGGGAMPPPPGEEGGDEDGDEMELEAVDTVECVGIAHSSIKWCASGGMDRTLKVWDMTSGGCRAVCQHKGGVVALKWHATLPIIGSAALDNVLRLWDARSGACLCAFTGHRRMVVNLDMSIVATEDGGSQDALVSVSDDHTAKVFHFDAKALLQP